MPSSPPPPSPLTPSSHVPLLDQVSARFDAGPSQSKRLSNSSTSSWPAGQRLRASAARLAAIEAREAERAAWLTEPQVRGVLAQGAAAVRELLDRAQDLDSPTTVEVPVVAGPRLATGRSESGR
jgi:hypothetical protein